MIIPAEPVDTSGEAVVTVIVPGRDVAAFADEALTSLQAQTMPRWRAVLVDDGSLDATGEIFARAAASDARIALIRHDRPQGLGAARNAGLALVQTPFVGFLDADDVLAPTALERLTGTLAATGSDFAVGAYVRLRPDEANGYTPGGIQPWVTASTSPERRGTTIDEHPAASGNVVAWSKVSRIEFWRRLGLRFPEGRLYEDQVVAQRMYAHARAFDVIPDVVVQWRERADGSSITQRTDAVAVLHDYLEAMSAGLAELESTGHRAAARERVNLILTMDLPPLVRIARDHAEPEYRRTLGAFVRALSHRATRDTQSAPAALDETSAALVSAAILW
ncbi:MAG: glycosyltransferase family 2 protein [Microbacterium sp.]